MPSLFLHRISVVRVYLYIAATTLDPAGRDLHHTVSQNSCRGCKLFFLMVLPFPHPCCHHGPLSATSILSSYSPFLAKAQAQAVPPLQFRISPQLDTHLICGGWQRLLPGNCGWWSPGLEPFYAQFLVPNPSMYSFSTQSDSTTHSQGQAFSILLGTDFEGMIKRK